jgi:hypothetical protein
MRDLGMRGWRETRKKKEKKGFPLPERSTPLAKTRLGWKKWTGVVSPNRFLLAPFPNLHVSGGEVERFGSPPLGRKHFVLAVTVAFGLGVNLPI